MPPQKLTAKANDGRPRTPAKTKPIGRLQSAKSRISRSAQLRARRSFMRSSAGRATKRWPAPLYRFGGQGLQRACQSVFAVGIGHFAASPAGRTLADTEHQ